MSLPGLSLGTFITESPPVHPLLSVSILLLSLAQVAFLHLDDPLFHLLRLFFCLLAMLEPRPTPQPIKRRLGICPE